MVDIMAGIVWLIYFVLNALAAFLTFCVIRSLFTGLFTFEIFWKFGIAIVIIYFIGQFFKDGSKQLSTRNY